MSLRRRYGGLKNLPDFCLSMCDATRFGGAEPLSLAFMTRSTSRLLFGSLEQGSRAPEAPLVGVDGYRHGSPCKIDREQVRWVILAREGSIV